MKNILKIIVVGIGTTISRIIGQFLIPPGEQSILDPSVFAVNGTMPLAFTLYGIFAYSIIAAMFLLIRDRMKGHPLAQGLKYGIAYSLIWIVYLWEPLPHVAPLDRITYPIVDSVALLVMGLLLGLFFGKSERHFFKKAKNFKIQPLLIITIIFVVGRVIQYLFFDIYSSFDEKNGETLLWCVLTGFIVACVMAWFNRYIMQKSRWKNAFILGGVLFGVNLILFNFFMPLVFAADIPDLILRTVVDTVAVTIGCLSFEPLSFEVSS